MQRQQWCGRRKFTVVDVEKTVSSETAGVCGDGIDCFARYGFAGRGRKRRVCGEPLETSSALRAPKGDEI